jgi:hypothetical protein
LSCGLPPFGRVPALRMQIVDLGALYLAVSNAFSLNLQFYPVESPTGGPPEAEFHRAGLKS